MTSTSDLRIIRLEAVKVAAYHFQYSTEPEGTAIQKVIEWASKNGILNVDLAPRFFGFNNPDPFRSSRKPEYGYEFWVTVSPDTSQSEGITVKTSEGGEYLALNGLGLAGWEWVKSKMGQWSKETGYEYDHSRQYLEEHVANTANFPSFVSLFAYKYLLESKAYLEDREHGRMKGDNWYGYVYPKNIEVMHSKKILVPDIADRAAFSTDENGSYTFTSGYGIILNENILLSEKYILGLLNSKLLFYFLTNISTTMRGGFFRYFSQYLEQLPIKSIDLSSPSDRTIHDQIVELVNAMLDLHKKLPATKTDQEKTIMQRQIDSTDRRIDELVYKLYGLTEQEIKIVEETSERK